MSEMPKTASDSESF